MAKRITEKTLIRTSRRIERIETPDGRSRRDTRLDRIRSYYLEDTALEDDDELYRTLLEQINAMLANSTEYPNPERVIRVILRMERFALDRGAAHRAVNDAIELYGNIAKSSKDGLRNILTNRFLRLGGLAEAHGDPETAAKMYDRVAKINALHEDTSAEAKVRRRVRVAYSSDPGVLGVEITEES